MPKDRFSLDKARIIVFIKSDHKVEIVNVSHITTKPFFLVPSRSDNEKAVQPKKIFRGFKIFELGSRVTVLSMQKKLIG